jgi:hypothetical protein
VRWLTNRNNFITVAFVELLMYPKYICRGVCFTCNKCVQGRKQEDIIRVTINFSQIKENLETNRFTDVQRLVHHIATSKLHYTNHSSKLQGNAGHIRETVTPGTRMAPKRILQRNLPHTNTQTHLPQAIIKYTSLHTLRKSF